MTDSVLLIKFETYIEMKKLDFATLTQAVVDCIRSYDEETGKVIREVQRIMSDKDDSDWVH